MKKNFVKNILLTLCISISSLSLVGCDLLDELLEPEHKTYNGTIYNDTNKQDEAFNNYDGEQESTENTENVENTENEIIETTPTETPTQTGAYDFDFEETRQYEISEVTSGGYKITFYMPDTIVDYTEITKIKKPKKQVVNLKKNSWAGSFYKYLGTDNQKLKLITAIYDLEQFDSIETLATMKPETLKKLKEEQKTLTIEESNIVELTVNGYTRVCYRIYPYDSEIGKSAIILVGAQVGEKYMYTEFWLDGIFENMDYDKFIVEMYSSATCSQTEDIVFE